ncbi:MAG: sigma-54-dependent Fis family transcriptional regulator [Candidatus Aminicenantes bacterium]|nr:sigma-54-dependent Fis family transcriptional regulator [Candidatus Aminicenantes bacterium]
MAGKILIVDDEKDMLLLLQRIISEDTDHELQTETNPFRALDLFKNNHFDLMITDLKMPKMDGIKLLEEAKKTRPKTSVVILTAFATIDTAVEAIRKGAYDYITKPFRRERILLTIDKVMKWQGMVRENLELRQALAESGQFASLIGSTRVMDNIFERIKQVAPTMGTVLITGPSGTGKELVARAIHQHSLRRTKNFITINCTAIPEEVIESELFGHVKGAFTGAWKDKKGLVEEAHEGTLFLDEIGDLSTRLQTKLLRLLQEGEYKPVGSVKTLKADLRFVAATNHNLTKEIAEKRFREDLFYRLNVIRFDLPPLKDRKEDIPLLSFHFLKKYARINQKDIGDISPAAMQALMAHDYKGNVRELENIIERGVIFCRDDSLEPDDLSIESAQDHLAPIMAPKMAGLSFKEAKDDMIQLFHKHYIEALLRKSGGNISRAAEMAGIQRQYLHRMMKEAGVDAAMFKGGKDI